MSDNPRRPVTRRSAPQGKSGGTQEDSSPAESDRQVSTEVTLHASKRGDQEGSSANEPNESSHESKRVDHPDDQSEVANQDNDQRGHRQPSGPPSNDDNPNDRDDNEGDHHGHRGLPQPRPSELPEPNVSNLLRNLLQVGTRNSDFGATTTKESRSTHPTSSRGKRGQTSQPSYPPISCTSDPRLEPSMSLGTPRRLPLPDPTSGMVRVAGLTISSHQKATQLIFKTGDTLSMNLRSVTAQLTQRLRLFARSPCLRCAISTTRRTYLFSSESNSLVYRGDQALVQRYLSAFTTCSTIDYVRCFPTVVCAT